MFKKLVKVFTVLLAVLFVATVTIGAASACEDNNCDNGHGNHCSEDHSCGHHNDDDNGCDEHGEHHNRCDDRCKDRC
jgi:hypothetical protein